MNYFNIFIGLMIPFVGTTLGAACVFFVKKQLNEGIQKALLGFASGVMIAASVWSLIIPAIDMSEDKGKLAFIPAALGIAIGMAFLLIMDKLIPHIHLDSNEPEGIKVSLKKQLCLSLLLLCTIFRREWQSG